MRRSITQVAFGALVLFVSSAHSVALADSVTVLFHFEGSDSGSKIGTALQSLGDVNGDGFGDIAINSKSPRGTYVFYGGNPSDTLPDLFLQGSSSISRMSDMTGDGIPDLLVSDATDSRIYLYRGFPDSLESTPYDSIVPDSAGYAFGGYLSVGMVGSDSVADLVFSDPNYPNHGKVYYYENPFSDDKVPDWAFLPGGFARNIRNVGLIDFDGDTQLDIFISMPGRVGEIGLVDTVGLIAVFLGPNYADTPDLVIAQPQGLDSIDWRQFPSGVANVADFDGDGWNDLAALYNTKPLIYLGGPSADTLVDFRLQGTTSLTSIAAAGDVNGDGGDDIVMGLTRTFWGAVDIYLGGSAMDIFYDLTITDDDLYPPRSIRNIGYQVASAGDFNGDGYDDILITCRNLPSPAGQPHVVYLVAGSPSIVTDVTDDIAPNLPCAFSLAQNHPNPFNLSTAISLDLPERQHVTLKVFNIVGRHVITLLDRRLPAGRHQVEWNGADDSGQWVGSGIYIYVLRGARGVKARKMLLLK